MGDGSLPPEQIERLEAVTAWMRQNGKSIVGTRAGLEPWQFYGPSTRREDRIFLHCLLQPYDLVTVRGIEAARVRAVRHLATGKPLAFEARLTVADRLAMNPRAVGELWIRCPKELVDPLATVIELEMRGD
jgi:alpha-L-fucosidase